MHKMILLFDDMPEETTVVGCRALLPDLLTIEASAKSEGYPKFIQLILLYLLSRTYDSIKRRREHEREEKERGEDGGSDDGAKAAE